MYFKDSGVTEGMRWVRLHRPREKILPLLKEYENQGKLYIDMNDTPVLDLFAKTLLLGSLDYPLVISYNQQCHIGTNVNYLRAIIISYAFSRAEL